MTNRNAAPRESYRKECTGLPIGLCRVCAVVVVVAFAGHCDIARAAGDMRWRALAPMPWGVFFAAVSRTHREVFVTGGVHQGGEPSDTVQVYHIETNRWWLGPPLKLGRFDHVQVTLPDGRILVAGGRHGPAIGQGATDLNSCELIDLSRNTVETVGTLAQPVRNGTMHLLRNGRAVFIGAKLAQVFDAEAKQWTRTIPLRRRRTSHASVLLPDDRIVLIGGTNSAAIEILDVTSKHSVVLTARLPHVTDDLSAALMPDGRIWILGGQHGKTGETLEQTWVLDMTDPRKAVLHDGPKLGASGGMADACVGTIDKWAIIAGGEAERAGHDAELSVARLLDMRKLRLYSLPSLPHPMDDAVSTMAGRGMIIFGGLRMVQGALGVAVRIPTVGKEVYQLVLPTEAFGGD